MSTPCAAAIRDAARTLEAAGVETPDRDARLLLRHVLHIDGTALTVRLNEDLQSDDADRYRELVARRAKREPLSHLIGTREFWGRSFEVSQDVLDPRPETECLVAEALHRGPFRRILDLGTGSGCILLTLLSEWTAAHGLGVDISEPALAIARRNAEEHGLMARCTLHQSDWYNSVDGVFDLIVSNPPYITADEVSDLAPEVQGFEPIIALTPGGDGLSAYQAIAAKAQRHLSPNGFLMVEIGPTQSHQVSAVFANAGLMVQAVIPDLDQRPRVIVAHL